MTYLTCPRDDDAHQNAPDGSINVAALFPPTPAVHWLESERTTRLLAQFRAEDEAEARARND